jgi:hypothetical protein
LFGRQFTGVYTPVIRLDVIKKKADEQWMVAVERAGTSYNVLQSRFVRNAHIAFDVQTKSDEEQLLERIYSISHQTLAGNAEWALGIVTGDNKKYVSAELGPEMEPIFRGSDIYPFFLGEPGSYIRFNSEKYQQVAAAKYYRAPEKLLYRFISNRLVFAYDDKQRLSLNSANILIPAIPGLGIKAALAFLNSTLFQFVFVKKFSTHKVLRGDLEQLPFPVIDHSVHERLEQLVDSAIACKKMPDELEEIIFAIFGFDNAERTLITEMIKR